MGSCNLIQGVSLRQAGKGVELRVSKRRPDVPFLTNRKEELANLLQPEKEIPAAPKGASR